MTGVVRAALAAGLVLFGTPTWAQMDQGRLQGLVSDAQQAMLPGVTVTARSPALMGSQVAVTEGDGRYRFPSLPPGRYTGTQTFFAEDIDNNRSDTIALVDLRVDRRIRFGGRYSVSLMADLFNALNSNDVSNFNLSNGAQFTRIIASIDPRTLMLGARFEF